MAEVSSPASSAGPLRRVAVLGDRRDHPSHRELDALLPMLREHGVDAAWVPTRGADPTALVTAYDGVWLVPGSPYDDDAAVYAAIRATRASGTPFLGTCGGHQYAVISHLGDVLGEPASHEESDGRAGDNAVTALACSLQGEARTVTPVPGSRLAGWVDAPFEGRHFCSFAPTAGAVERLVASGVVVGATAPDAGAEVLEFPDHPFFVTSLFQPHVGTLAGAPLHPLIRAFLDAVLARPAARARPADLACAAPACRGS